MSVKSTLYCFHLLRKLESFVMSQRALICHFNDNTPARYWFAPVRFSFWTTKHQFSAGSDNLTCLAGGCKHSAKYAAFWTSTQFWG